MGAADSLHCVDACVCVFVWCVLVCLCGCRGDNDVNALDQEEFAEAIVRLGVYHNKSCVPLVVVACDVGEHAMRAAGGRACAGSSCDG